MESRKLISATDTQYSGSLLTSLNEQRIQGIFCDVTVIVEDKKFRAHKNILSASSTYFHQRFSVARDVIELSFVRAEIFAEILNYIYSSKIIRVRSDLLEELIKSGRLLGVKFIADLGIPLSQMKSMASTVKDNGVITSPDSNQKETDIGKTATEQATKSALSKDNDASAMPVVTEAITMSTEEQETKESADCNKGKGSDDDDVIFCSELVPPKPQVSNTTDIAQQRVSPDVVELSNQQLSIKSSVSQTPFIPKAESPSNLPLKGATPSQTHLSVNASNPSQTQASGAMIGPYRNHRIANTMLLNQQPLNSSSIISFPQKRITPINMLVQHLPSNNTFSGKQVIIRGRSHASSPDAISRALIHQANMEKAAGFDGPRLQNPQMAILTQGTNSKPGVLKIKTSDVNPGSNKDCSGGTGSGSPHILDGKKIITLDTPSEIGGLSTGCKVYANIGEDTYDIVIPIKEDPDEDDGAVELPRSIDGSPDSKRMKVKHEDHYELIVDGKVYYICIVCKRSYVCITSLRRHFNCHSWEKKYPCHYCERIFPLAEYRTKHEILHTGERRYQCLTCGDAFINYQIMASHIRSTHGLDPSKDPKIYHLHPCKTLQIRPYTYAANAQHSSSTPVTNDGVVYDVDVDDDNEKAATTTEGTDTSFSSKQMNWDDVFVQQETQPVFKPSPSEGSTEFEFVIPESY